MSVEGGREQDTAGRALAREFVSGVIACMVALLVAAPAAFARGDADAFTAKFGPAEVAMVELPREARETLSLIARGGPFPHERDGVVFGNFERLLPPQERGYYREYTVRTPGVTHRGPRRIVTGKNGERFYTDDHYRSFRRIRE